MHEPGVKTDPQAPLMEAIGVTKRFRRRTALGVLDGNGREAAAVDGVSIQIFRGETLGLVGGSGSGKSTVGRLLLGLLKLDAGRVLFMGEDTASMPPSRMKTMRRAVAAVFQDPASSLDPRMTAERLLAEPLRINGLWRDGGAEKTGRMLDAVGLGRSCLRKHPHEFSGGQRQRLAIARALMLDPAAVILDEAVSALDPSVQAQILNLLAELGGARGLSYLFISHDLRAVLHMSDRVAVMNGGKIVECGSAAEIGAGGIHPCTRMLFSSLPGCA
jgi:ABC-type glutathione transport system ATPase component